MIPTATKTPVRSLIIDMLAARHRNGDGAGYILLGPEVQADLDALVAADLIEVKPGRLPEYAIARLVGDARTVWVDQPLPAIPDWESL